MPATDTGIQGAKRQSFHKASPRGLLMKLITDNPGADEIALLRMFTSKVQEEDEYLPAMIEYWFAHNYRSLVNDGRAPTRRTTTAAKVVTVEQIKEKVNQRIHEVALEISLDTILPNHKMLRHSTFAYCAKLGGGLSRIAQQGRPRQLVGSVLSETEVKNLYGDRRSTAQAA